MKFTTFVIAILALSTVHVSAQNDNAKAYIEQYKDLAIREQMRTGVPAAIKLAQGIHETAAGTSELSQNANNHFGIKCKSNWQGETYAYTDDRKDECFRKYNNDSTSYIDHSNFLKTNPRYATLFTYDVNDYKSWAHGLKKAGYATNPHYAARLIETIDKYDLNSYTLVAINAQKNPEVLYASAVPMLVTTTAPTAQSNNVKATVNSETSKPQQPKDYYITQELNGLKGFYAPKGEMLLNYAIKNKIKYSKILEMNELPDQPLEADMFIYLTKKHRVGLIETYTVNEGETLVQISQATGVQLQQIKQLNKLVDGVEPKAGSILYLQTENDSAPEVYIPQPNAKSKTNVARVNNNDNYITVNKPTETAKEEVFTFNKDKKTEDNIVANNNPTTKKTVDYSVSATTKNTSSTVAAPKAESVAPKNNTPAKTTVTSEQNISAYEKLKRHMDNKIQDNSSAAISTNEVAEEDFTITPPAKRANVVENNKTTSTLKTTSTAAPTKTAKPKTYKVKKGDTLAAISKKHGVTVKQLQTWNKVSPKSIQPGQILKVSK